MAKYKFKRDVNNGAMTKAHDRREDFEMTYSTSELNEEGEEDIY